MKALEDWKEGRLIQLRVGWLMFGDDPKHDKRIRRKATKVKKLTLKQFRAGQGKSI